MSLYIFYDMDEVLNKFSKAVISRYNKDFNDNFNWRENKKWGWKDAPKGNPDYFDRIINEPGFFYDIPPDQEGIYYMNLLLKEGFDVKIITFPQWNAHCSGEKINWLKSHSPNFANYKRVIMTQDKEILAGPDRILLDDNPTNLIQWRSKGGIAIAFDRAFNQEWDGPRVKNHKEFYDYVKALEKTKLKIEKEFSGTIDLLSFKNYYSNILEYKKKNNQ